jgi:hypothetical protein
MSDGEQVSRGARRRLRQVGLAVAARVAVILAKEAPSVPRGRKCARAAGAKAKAGHACTRKSKIKSS